MPKSESAPPRRVTIRDVALAAGVSRQTVTRAVNEMPEISEETRQRVMRTVEELGYRPNRFAIDLSRQRSLAIGLIVGTFHNPYYAQLADAFVTELRRRDWQVVVGTADQGEAAAVRSMASQADAIIGYFVEPQSAFAPAARGVPIITLEERATIPGVHSVELDFRTGIADLVTALRAKGASRFAMIDAANPMPDGTTTSSPRRLLFEEAVGESCLVVTEPESIAGGVNGFKRILDENPHIDAILAFNDLMAMGAIQGAHTLGVDVPGRVRIAGIDGISLGEAISPTLTTLSLQTQAVAAEAASIVAQLFTAEHMPTASITRAVTPVVVWRESA
ncbi:transcriptional regulator, LacI family [Arthrobacter sp. cf158]|uniref:LacI family DNA-binding transcriptional regulator n=1 Tax=Arthrobacter sp. cf158 TaxID=1761744 RepID=UPI000896DBF5|nr:LacI family DNA-binding transcriptional regulator [Arthrobacter sp. cf158]SDX50883.1 transcriptional regulator, LacI family [Arthrobacter sp. cf158]